MLKILLLEFSFLAFYPADITDSVNEEPTKLFYFKSQYAGNLGLISAGGGYDSKNFLADVSFGYLPKHINGVRVFTLSFKPSYKLAEMSFNSIDAGFYIGTAINYSIGRNIYGKIPDYYPPDYYWPNAFHFNPFAGARLGLREKRGKKLYLYTELGTVDYKIWFAVKNRHVSVMDILNLGFGIMVRHNGSP